MDANDIRNDGKLDSTRLSVFHLANRINILCLLIFGNYLHSGDVEISIDVKKIKVCVPRYIPSSELLSSFEKAVIERQDNCTQIDTYNKLKQSLKDNITASENDDSANWIKSNKLLSDKDKNDLQIASVNQNLLKSTSMDTVNVKYRALGAIIPNRKWEIGRHLHCTFLEGSSIQQTNVIKNAKLWEKYANIHFDFDNSTAAEIRISFGFIGTNKEDDGSWSAVGTDCLVQSVYPPGSPTMNFGWLNDQTSDQEWERTTVHEFGHALGLIHEHQSYNANLDWNKPVVYAYFEGPPNNWTSAMVDANVFQRYSVTETNASAFDGKSIMLYYFPNEFFFNNIGTANNYELSTMDETFIQTSYPFGK
jgi:hypothetical protein